MFQVGASLSTKARRAPMYTAALAVATNVKLDIRTSSPQPYPQELEC